MTLEGGAIVDSVTVDPSPPRGDSVTVVLPTSRGSSVTAVPSPRAGSASEVFKGGTLTRGSAGFISFLQQ